MRTDVCTDEGMEDMTSQQNFLGLMGLPSFQVWFSAFSTRVSSSNNNTGKESETAKETLSALIISKEFCAIPSASRKKTDQCDVLGIGVFFFLPIYSYFEKGCRKKASKCTRQDRKVV